MSPFIDIAGNKYGRLLVVSRSANTCDKKATWLCRCDCGKTTIVIACHLKSGNTKSCGCHNLETMSKNGKNRTTHGMRYTPEYRVWINMKGRCFDPKDKGYRRYGARGITVCKRWMKFENFIADMGLRPSPKHSIDRQDNNKNYTQSNCRWVTSRVQQNNRSSNTIVEYRGLSMTLANAIRKAGSVARKSTVLQRIYRMDWGLIEALETPPWGRSRKCV